jgi:hypothetical protein
VHSSTSLRIVSIFDHELDIKRPKRDLAENIHLTDLSSAEYHLHIHYQAELPLVDQFSVDILPSEQFCLHRNNLNGF